MCVCVYCVSVYLFLLCMVDIEYFPSRRYRFHFCFLKKEELQKTIADGFPIFAL